jgi:hypothetical protein
MLQRFINLQTFGGVCSPSSCLYAVQKTLDANPEFDDPRCKILRNMSLTTILILLTLKTPKFKI